MAGSSLVERFSLAGRRFASFVVDLATLEPSGAQGLLSRVEEELGPVDILVNNAGTIKRAPAAEHPAEEWREVLAVNLDAVWHLSQAAGKVIEAPARDGAAVVDTTGAGTRGMPDCCTPSSPAASPAEHCSSRTRWRRGRSAGSGRFRRSMVSCRGCSRRLRQAESGNQGVEHEGSLRVARAS